MASLRCIQFLFLIIAVGYATAETNSITENTSKPSTGCKVPILRNGTYTVHGKPYFKGSIVPVHGLLHTHCDDGYYPTSKIPTYCGDTSLWNRHPPKCLQMCPALSKPNVAFRCRVPGRVEYTTCYQELPQNTVAYAACKDGYYSIRTQEPLTCKDGSWDVEEWETMCSKIQTKYAPWHAWFYRLNSTSSEYQYSCGGTIVSDNVIISSARCFYDSDIDYRDVKNNKVAVGKKYVEWNDDMDKDNPLVQKFEVAKIMIPEEYDLEYESFYNHDIAVVILETPIKFSQYVGPAFLDLESGLFDQEQTVSGVDGIMFSMYMTPGEEIVDDGLKTGIFPIRTLDDCRESSPTSFHPYIIDTKICAGNLDGVHTCCNEVGSGLVVQLSGTDEPFLRGVMSNDYDDKDDEDCEKGRYSLFTHVFKFRKFLKESMAHAGIGTH